MQNDMRDRLVELLQEYTDNNNGGGSNHGRADHLIANGVIVPQWISVKDRLPEEKERVLVFLKRGNRTKGYTEIDTDRLIKRIWVRWGSYVTHWMPLPEPPKAEQKAKELSGNG